MWLVVLFLGMVSPVPRGKCLAPRHEQRKRLFELYPLLDSLFDGVAFDPCPDHGIGHPPCDQADR
ncbi:MAG: hypothetical protein J6W31_05245, partial [Clostridia bacterium]|nr:hypothetical protein [Clostridia bacterium]